MKKTKHHRPLALLLCAALLISQSGAAAYAEEMGTGSAGGLCEHHTEHIGCGYTEAQPGHPCEHKHGLDCCTDELICGLDENTTETASVSGAGHTRTQDCYALDCPHARGEHDGDCGCIDAAGGTPCGYVRAACGKPDKDGGHGAVRG